MVKLLLHPGFISGTGFRFAAKPNEEKGFYRTVIFFLIFSVIIPGKILLAQTGKAGNSGSALWASAPFGQNDFVENKGQFSGSNGINADVLFGATGSGVNIYFSSNGLTYRYDEWVEMSKQEKEELTRQYSTREQNEEEEMYKRVPHYLHMEWVGANSKTEVTAEEKVSCYYTYPETKGAGTGTIIANAFKKIIYKNLYPGIDVEYIIPEDKPGLKYSVILHPGADASVIRMKYINEEKMFFDVHGNTVITSDYGNFTDHAPHTFYQGSPETIASEFILENNEVSFRLENYDASKEVIIDPWTSTPTFTTNSAYDVNFDLAGNVYAYGSLNPFQLCKFNSAGALQWVYNASTMNNSGCPGAPYGDFAVDEVTGSSYLAEAFNPATGCHVYKINTNGIQVGVSPGISQFNELWRIEYNRCIGKLIGAGGGTSGTYQGIVIDTSLLSWTPVNILSTFESFHDMCLLSIDNGSNFCYMVSAQTSISSSFNNTIFKCPIPSLMPVYVVPSGHNFQESFNANYLVGGCANGFNGMTNSPNWLYTYDGVNLKRWNKTTGAFVTSLNLGGSPFSWGGIWADECDNIYVGYQSTVRVYNTSLTLVNTYNLPNTVYDVKMGTNNKLYACGNGFVTSIDVPPNNMTIVTASTPSSCLQCTGTASVTTTSCNGGSFNYLWQPGNQTTQTATGLCAGIYTVTLTSNCNNTFTATVTVASQNLPPLVTVSSQTICIGQSATLTASGANTYSWSPSTALSATTGASVTANPTSTTTYTVTGDVNGCTATAQVTVTVNPLPVLSVSPTQAICNGQSATLTASGAQTYSWSPSTNLSSSTGSPVTASPASTTTYTVTGTDNNGCTTATQVTVNVNPLPVVSVTPPPVICAGQQTATLTANGAQTYAWTPSANLSSSTGSPVTASPAATTTYTVTGTDNNGCTASAQVTVNVNPLPVVLITPPPAICVGQQTATLTASGAQAYSWSPSTNLSSSTGSPVTASPASTTAYTVTGTDNNGCTASAQVTVNVNPLPVVLVAPPPAICVGQQTATLNASGAQTYSWSPSTNLSSSTGSPVTASPAATTTYTVTGTDNNGCTASSQVTVNVNPLPLVTITPPPAICNGQSATLNANGANTYSWSPSAALSSTTGASVTANPSSTTTYTVTGNANGCTATAQVTVTVNPLPVLSVSPTQTICIGQSATLTAIGANTYSWSPPTGLSSTTGASVTANPSSTTTYTVTGDLNGCTATAQVSITVNTLPVISVSPSSTICNGQQATLTANGANTYSWSPSTALSSTTGASVIANPSATTTYTVTGNNNGCTATSQVTVTVNPLPALSISPAQTICNGQQTTLTAGGANTYSWSPSTALSSTTGASVTANPSATTTYTVTGDLNGCTATMQVTVTVNPLPVLSVSPPQTICNGQPATLTAGGATTYSWSPSTALSSTTGASVTANPSSTTTYTVTGNLNGCTATAQITVTVSSLPVVSVSPSQTICNGQQATLTAGGANTYSWSPSTALSSTTGASVTANPSSTTIYTVTGDLNGCTASAQITISVNPVPVLSVSPSQTICNGQSAMLTVSGANAYSWSPSTALSSTTGASVTANPSSTTTYTVTGDLNGCTATAQVTLTVNPLPVLAVSPSQTICNGQSATLIAGGANTYSWSPSTALSSTTGASVTANPSSTTTYTIIGDLSGCTATAQVMVTVNPVPVLSVSPSQTICNGQLAILTAGGANTYSWSPSTALSSTTGASVTANPSSTTAYVVTGDLGGCTATAQVTVTVNPVPVLSVSPSQTICNGQSATLIVGGANTYSWSPSTALSSTTGASVTANPSSTTTYTVTGDLSGCTAAAIVTVTVNPLPVVNIMPDSLSGCSPVTVAFLDMSSIPSPSTLSSWLWNFGDNASGNSNTSTLQNPSHTYNSTGSYTVTLTVTSNNGCVANDSIINLVTVYSNPVASFYAVPKIVSMNEPVITFINTSLSYDYLLWDFGDNHTSTQINPGHTYADTGTYTVMLVTTTIHGCSDTAYEEIIVKPEFSFYVPNVFSPNSDGTNDVFTGVGINVKQLTMYIYDRWGEIIFQSNDLEKPWDGRVTGSGKIAQEGVYVYLINITDIFDKKHQYIGSVTLLK